MGVCKDQFTARRDEGVLQKQRKGDHGFCWRADFVEQFRLEIVRDGHFAGGHLFRSSTDEAQLAMAKAFGAVFASGAHRRAEYAASHGPPRLHIAATGCGVERRTCGIVGEVFEAGLVSRGTAKRAGVSIAGKIRAVLREPGAGAALDLGREHGICGAQLGHSGAEARGVKRVDGEGSMAALRAADTAGKERSGTASGLGKRSIHDLHKLGIARRKVHKRKHSG